MQNFLKLVKQTNNGNKQNKILTKIYNWQIPNEVNTILK